MTEHWNIGLFNKFFDSFTLFLYSTIPLFQNNPFTSGLI